MADNAFIIKTSQREGFYNVTNCIVTLWVGENGLKLFDNTTNNARRRVKMKMRIQLASVLAAFMIGCIGIVNGNAAGTTIRFSSGAPESHFLTKQYL